MINSGAKSNLIGGYLPSARNVICSNAITGIMITDTNTSDNVVAGNFIGIDASGTSSLQNVSDGIAIIHGSQSNVIGGAIAGAGNVISGNGGSGVFLGDPGTDGNTIQGNYIGLNAAGSVAVPNLFFGIEIDSGPGGNTLGGTHVLERNVISGNGAAGVTVYGTNTAKNIIVGNYIGLNAYGSDAIPNTGNGVEICQGASDTVVGGLGGRNCISGNHGSGVSIHDTGTAANVVQGNTIGLNASEAGAVPNAGGVIITGGAQGNLIGGLTWGTPNIIASNIWNGLELWDAPTSNNTFRVNSIYGNGSASISLNKGANRSAVAPSLTSAVLTTNTTISGSLTSLANTTFEIDFYSSPATPAQGMTYLGSESVTTSAGGSVSFAASLNGHVPVGRIITVTATDPPGNTSGMSGGVTVTATSTVNDGIPDAWRALYFGGSGKTTNSQSCATCDPDHDGMNNVQEFFAGTNPTNSGSALKLNTIPSISSNSISSFQSAAGIVYRVQYRDDLVHIFWSILADQVVGTGTNIFIVDPSESATGKRFYRLQVLW
jgi:hypothetical protein